MEKRFLSQGGMFKGVLASLAALFLAVSPACASEASLVVPNIKASSVFSFNLLIVGMAVSIIGLVFGFIEFLKIKGVKAHTCMTDVGNLIFETCKTYLVQQGKFLIALEVLIGLCIAFYFGYLEHMGWHGVLLILGWSIVGILGSYSVAWFGIRMNTLANARTAFTALKGNPMDILNLPLKAGMSIGVFLVSTELIMMLIILLFVPGKLAGACFIGFAIGESLGASALRVAGGIFTKIADIGSDLMKIQFNIKEDDPRNPGVIADCTGDNAGDSIGPTADGFETYGVTGVALVSFILLAVQDPAMQVKLLVWIFVMRILGIIASVLAYYINGLIGKIKYDKADDINFEKPLSSLVWITSILSMVGVFCASYFLLGDLPNHMWLALSIIISCGTLGAALIPELTKLFTSPTSKHVNDVVKASQQGGASLNILSGIVAGNFGGFWTGLVFVFLMLLSYMAGTGF